MTPEVGDSADVPEKAIEWMATWHCFLDACPKCQNLNGYPFYGFEIPVVLWHPQWGPVWDLVANHSLTHPNCRCDVELHISININGEVVEVDVVSLSEAKEGIAGLSDELGKLTESMRGYLIAARMLGLPPEFTQALLLIRRAQTGMDRLSQTIGAEGRGAGGVFQEGRLAGGMGATSFTTAMMVALAELYGLKFGTEWTLKLLGIAPDTERVKAWQAQQQHEVEKFKLSLRGIHY